MTISVDLPQAGGFIGPGYLMSVRTSLFGPFPDTYQWVVDVETATPLSVIYGVQTLNPITSVINHRLWAKAPAGHAVADVRTGAAFSASIQITALVIDRATSIHIDGPTTIPGFFWDPFGGLGVLILDSAASSGGDVFTTADRTTIEETHRAVSLVTYVESTLHLGIAGSVTLDLAALTRAVRWTVTTFPPNVAVDPGNPNYYFNLGFITPVLASGAIKSSRVSFSPQTLALPEACHRIQVDLAPFVQIEIMELVAPNA